EAQLVLEAGRFRPLRGQLELPLADVLADHRASILSGEEYRRGPVATADVQHLGVALDTGELRHDVVGAVHGSLEGVALAPRAHVHVVLPEPAIDLVGGTVVIALRLLDDGADR